MALSHQTRVQPTSEVDEDLKARIKSIWLKNLPILCERLDLLASAAVAAQTHTLSEPFRTEAISTAHKLAGSLGAFGYPEGTSLALRLEAALATSSPEPETLAQLTEELRATLRLAA